jgi:alkylation response protein AidB-like acyl-CoA dehydrogenase
MHFRLEPEEENFRQEVRDFLMNELPPGWQTTKGHHAGLETEEEWAFYQSMMRKLGAKGWLTLAWPREYGGQGDTIKQFILSEEMYYYGAPGLDMPGVYMLSPILIRYGSEEQKKQHLPHIASGEILWCECFSEPGAGSDLASVSTRAVEDGDFLMVNGQKTWVTQAHRADWGFALVRTDPKAPKHKGITFLLVDMKTPGITVRPISDLAGMKTINEIFFDDVRVPKSNVVGALHEGWSLVRALLGFERSGIHRISQARRVVDLLLDYIKETTYGGEPLANAPWIRRKIAEAATQCEVARLFAYNVAWLQSKELSPPLDISMTQLVGHELQQYVSDAGMQILGLFGQLKENSKWAQLEGAIEHLYLTSIGATFAAGSSEIMRNIIAVRGLGLPRE